MEAPREYAGGFTKRSIIGALFVGFIMMPGSIYLGLLAGQGLGPAAEWVTIILFTEAARRSFTVLRRQEIYILYYMAGALTGGIGLVALSGGPFAGLIWNQYLVQSDGQVSFVRGTKHLHAGNGAHERHILQGLMRRSVGLGEEARRQG